MAGKAETAPATVKMTVARGRTLDDGVRKITEGAEVALPADEARRLHALGYLRMPGEGETRPPQHSLVTVQDGVGMVTTDEAAGE